MTLEVTDPRPVERAEEILTPAALDFVEKLHRRFAKRRDELLAARATQRAAAARGGRLDFRPDTHHMREAEWRVAEAPAARQDRRVDMTGPATPAKMAINALNSGAKVWLADLEDATCPTWPNVIDALLNLKDAAHGSLAYVADTGREYRLCSQDSLAVAVTRPRGWHLDEAHLLVDGRRTIGALVDFGLHFFHLAQVLINNGVGPYYYLPKMESHFEARLWNEVFTFAQHELGIPQGSVRAMVVIETIPAAFEMDGIQQLHTHVNQDTFARYSLPARDLIAELCLSDDFVDFLTIPAYERVV